MLKKYKKTKSDSYLPEDVFYAGFGIAAMAKEQFDDFTSFLIKEGKLLSKDRTKFRKQLIQKGEKYYKTMMKDVKKVAPLVLLNKLNMPTRKEFEELKKKVEGKNKSCKTKKK